MVQQKRLMLSDRKVLPSFLTSLLGSSCHSLLVPQTIGQRFSQSIKNDILVFILGFALTLSAYAKDYGIDFDDHDHPVKAFKCRCGTKFCRNIKRSSRSRSAASRR
ncbi:hypothetical protein CsSME_00019669 [Camellia sinensis var. sinensis]